MMVVPRRAVVVLLVLRGGSIECAIAEWDSEVGRDVALQYAKAIMIGKDQGWRLTR